MIGDGCNRHQITYIDDVVEALVLCGQRVGSRGERFIIGSGEITSVNDFVRRIAKELGVNQDFKTWPAMPFTLVSKLYRTLFGRFGLSPGIIDGWDFYTGERIFDVSRATKELGFQAQISLKEGIRRSVEWYRQTGHLSA